jgi:UDP-N-acetylmuramate: L-alanyl-gamma-D-glutamyl-meso-diaminopimelate ligase
MEMTPQALYQKNLDKQRIVIVGEERHQLVKMIAVVLQQCNRKVDFFSEGKLTEQASSPAIIIEADENLTGYHHHMGVLTPTSSMNMAEVMQFADTTPKGGTLIYPEENAQLKSLLGKERADVQVIPYKILSHQIKDGSVFLVSSANEKFPIKLKGNQNLVLLSVAKELLKKIGISSGQFYKAAATLQ